MRELIKLALKYRATAGFGSKLTETAIQKSLYELKRNLSETNPVREQLPYYWFKAGPYSEYVSIELERMATDGILKKDQRDSYLLFELEERFGSKRFIEHDENLIEARQILQQIVSNLQPFSIEKEIKSQYEEDAPFLFYPRFKLEFLSNIEGYYHLITHAGRIQNQSQRECLSKLLSVSTASLPINSLFSDFKRAYFDFETSVYRILRWKKPEKDEKYQQLFSNTISLSHDLWSTFAYGARIVKHDPIYDQKVGNWIEKFAEEVINLTSKTTEFYLMVLKTTEPQDFEEEILSVQKFTKLILDYRSRREITFINFQNKPSTDLLNHIEDEIKNLPEFSAFINHGQLDWSIIKKLSNERLAEIIQKSAHLDPIFVAYSDNGPRTVTYRIEPNSLSFVEQTGILS